MASTPPDSHPDSSPQGDDPAIEQVTPDGGPARTNVEEESPQEDAGSDGGTAGTGGTAHPQDHDVTS